MPKFYVLDEREIWHAAASDAARRHGYESTRIFSGEFNLGACEPKDVGFIRPHADWRQLPANRADYASMAEAGLTMIQDQAQIDVYEDKSAQFRKWFDWMPETWLFNDADAAQGFLDHAPYPLVSKANVGASSVNVRILKDKAEAQKHIAQLFGAGVWVQHGANCPQTKQKGYALLQRFIPHTITYRVNAIGDARAVFFRYCYPDRPVAQTGNVEPAFEMTAQLESLLDYCDRVFADIGSKWCALDVLKDGGDWKLLETSLAFPWPSPGRCNDGTIFRSKNRKWIDLFECMFDEVERGAWSSGH